MKKIKLTATSVGGELTTVNIYHTSASAENLITASVQASKLLTPGFDLIVSESVGTIIVQGDVGTVCNNITSSVVVAFPQTKRYFDVYSDGTGTVQINAPTSAGPTIGSLAQTVDFAIYSTFVIEGTAPYGYTFDGWYNGPEGSGAGLLSTDNPLTITQTTYTGSDAFYGHFS